MYVCMYAEAEFQLLRADKELPHQIAEVAATATAKLMSIMISSVLLLI